VLCDLHAEPLDPQARAEATSRAAVTSVSATEAASGRRAGNLRTRLNSFVGREVELRALREELPTARLLTLTGPGGAGKTRLAQAAEVVAARYPDGVWMVELAPLDDPRAVVDAALGALGLRATHLHLGRAEALTGGAAEAETPLQRLLDHRAQRSLLVLSTRSRPIREAADTTSGPGHGQRSDGRRCAPPGFGSASPPG
jgi:hypothetical protein